MRRHTIPAIFAAMAALIASPAMANADTQAWGTVTIKAALPDDFKIENELVFRTSDAKGFYELENNFMLGRKVGDGVTVWLGYTFNPQYSHGTFTRREHRFRQQVNFDSIATLGKVKVSGRVRLEERWREGISETGWRLRPQIKASMPLTGKLKLSVASESFFNLNTNSFQTNGGLDRLRNSIAVSAPLNKVVSIEAGYLNQHGFVPNGPDKSDHVLTMGLTASF